MDDVILEMRNITKDYPGVRALDQVNIRLRKGKVLALVGENGAGKSTLVKILSGVVSHSEFKGEILLAGEHVQFSGTREAEAAGISIIHQELNLLQNVSVAENVFLDRQPLSSSGMINWDRMYVDSNKILRRLNASFDSRLILEELSVGQQQIVEIAKALSLNTHILVLDEPTSALTDKEKNELFGVIDELKKDNVSIVFISHKFDEIEQVADEVVVLRDGRVIGDVIPFDEIDTDKIIAKMVGRKMEEMFPKTHFERGKKTLEVRNLTVKHPQLQNKYLVNDISFEAYEGELLTIYGLMGSGRTELANAIFGVYGKSVEGEIMLNNNRLYHASPSDAIKNGIGLVTEDRKNLGLLLDQEIPFNMTIASLDRFVSRFIMDGLKEREVTQKYVDELDVKTPSLDVQVKQLSGGNQQKIVLGKWLVTESEVLILDEPTKGIDVGAKVEVYRLINELIRQGVTVIMISSELPEVLSMSDRVLVMCENRKVADLTRQEITEEILMEYATGSFERSAMQ